MNEKLIIDLAGCSTQGESGIRCSYKHHPDNRGFDVLLEMVRFAMICRRCEAAPCVTACPRNALEKLPSRYNDAGVLKRHNMLCTGCGTCALACPFGTVYTDLIPFPSSTCDLCKGRLKDGEKPLCVRTSDGRVDYTAVDPSTRQDLVEVFDGIVARVADGAVWRPLLRDQKPLEAGR
ncbi:MAG TPA: 4Fe-4S dicluster domain-containing protein [Phycisphaerales bacterium]|nr:4Fe-4S dicluster domain-containing protein [Phycisphaerales bacterium]